MIWLIILLILVALLLFLIFPGQSTKKQREPLIKRNYAHRGLHSKDKKIPENSMAAFSRAIASGYGIELDIQFSKDEKIVVFHDNTLNRVCNIDGRVDAYTYEELQKFSLCSTSERIPLFTDVLALVNGQVPLIVELKNGSKNTKLCEAAYQILSSYQGDFCIESFNPVIVGWFKKNAKEIVRGQLSAPAKEFEGSTNHFFAYLLSRLLTNFISRPQFIAYSKKKPSVLVMLPGLLGAMNAVWTVRTDDDCSYYEKTNDIVIFEYYHPHIKNC